MNTTKYIIALVVVLGAGGLGYTWWNYGPGSNNAEVSINPPPGSVVQGASTESVAALAQKDLATRLGISQEAVTIGTVEEREWPDACLGLLDKEAVCATVITPGYKIMLEAYGKIYVYRANTSGSVLKLES